MKVPRDYVISKTKKNSQQHWNQREQMGMTPFQWWDNQSFVVVQTVLVHNKDVVVLPLSTMYHFEHHILGKKMVHQS